MDKGSPYNFRLQAKLRWARRCNYCCYAGLLALFVLWNLFLPGGSIKLWVLQTVPLLLVLPGFIKQTHRSHLWLCFILLLYLVAGVVEVVMPSRGWQHGALTLLSFTLFISAMMTSRWQRLLQLAG